MVGGGNGCWGKKMKTEVVGKKMKKKRKGKTFEMYNIYPCICMMKAKSNLFISAKSHIEKAVLREMIAHAGFRSGAD